MFAGLKVVELASVLAGPGVGQFFAELGADVIKVENLKTSGDVTRTWKVKGEKEGNVSAYFSSVNWGKRSLAIDLSKTRGKEIVQDLASMADIIIASYKPGDAEKLGVDYKTLSKKNPFLIYGQVTGYGPDNDRVGYDAVIQAESGFMDLNGEPLGLPTKMPVALIDVLAGHQLKEGLLLSLFNKQKTGRGDFIEVSLIQTAISSLANQATNWLVAGKLPSRQGSAHPNIAPYGDNYLTKDHKRVLLAIGSDRQFEDLCRMLDMASVSANPLFITNQLRVANREQLNAHLGQGIAQLTANEFVGRCNQLKIPAGIIQNLKEVFEMEESKELLINHAQSTGLRTLVSHSNGRLPDVSHMQPPPVFGQHSHLVLEVELGLSKEEISQLSSTGVIN